MVVPQLVFKDVPTQRLEIPKSVILTHMGERDAIRIFCQAVSRTHDVRWAAGLPVASDLDGRSRVRARRQGLREFGT